MKHEESKKRLTAADRVRVQKGHRAAAEGDYSVGHKSITALAFLLLLLLGAAQAHAGLCIVPTESGAWRNYNPATLSITTLDFRMECRDASVTQCSGDICTTTSAVAPHYFIRLFGSCTPTDCPWGEVEGVRLSGSLDGWYYFTYNQGFAQVYVYARTYPEWPGWLRLYIWNDFTDPSRADFEIDEWFVRR